MIQIFDNDKERILHHTPIEEVTENFDFNNHWVHLSNPTDKEIEFISRVCAVPEEMIKAALDDEERPRIEREGNIILTINEIGRAHV